MLSTILFDMLIPEKSYLNEKLGFSNMGGIQFPSQKNSRKAEYNSRLLK